MASLFRNFAVLRLMHSFPFAPIQILTGDTRQGCSSRRGRLLDECRSLQRKPCIERRFESLPGVQRFANLWGTFGSFRTSEKNKTVPFREAPRFCKPRFSSPQWRLRTNKIKAFPKENSRFCKPRISPLKRQLRTNPIKSFENFYILFVRHKKYDKKALPCRERIEVLQTSIQLATAVASQQIQKGILP